MDVELVKKIKDGRAIEAIMDWRRSNPRTARLDLEGADLADADLHLTHLSYANLSRANLDRANLNGADLREAMLAERQERQKNCNSRRF